MVLASKAGQVSEVNLGHRNTKTAGQESEVNRGHRNTNNYSAGAGSAKLGTAIVTTTIHGTGLLE